MRRGGVHLAICTAFVWYVACTGNRLATAGCLLVLIAVLLVHVRLLESRKVSQETS